MRSLLILLSALVVTACDTTIEAKDYKQTCSTDAECVPVFVGQFCNGGCGGCANAAINQSDVSRYTSDVTTITNACVRVGPPVLCAAAACRQPEAACVNGACALKAFP
jgi:hypothetical protein